MMNEKGKELSYLEILEKIKDLSGVERRYYNYLPDECWKSEDTQAKELKIGRKKLRRLKKKFIDEGILELQLQPNGKRNNPKHLLLKRDSIRLREREELYSRYALSDDSYVDDTYYYINDIDWSLLQTYTADDINTMSKLGKVELYMDCGFLVLPTHYPIFTDNGVKCSCKLAYKCSNKGKHPLFRYGYIDSLNYESIKEKYLNAFRKNPDLNIGFKVMGYSVLDVDFRHNGHLTLKDLMEEYEFEIKGTLTVNSGNGNHIYLSNKNLKNLPNALGNGLDLRSDTGFIMAPGSIHYSGKEYEWKLIGELATLPIDWIEVESEENESESYKDGKNKQISSNETARIKLQDITPPKTLTSDYVIKCGTRQSTLFKLACRERGNGKNTEQIYDALLTIRDTYCEDGEEPITDEEIRNTADSAAKYQTNKEKRLMALKP